MDSYLGGVYISALLTFYMLCLMYMKFVNKCGHTWTSFSSKDLALYTCAQFILLLNWRLVMCLKQIFAPFASL